MEELKFSKLSEMMTVKNQLIIADTEYLLNIYKDADDETLEMLFEGIKLIFEIDEQFLYLKDEYIYKIICLISELKEKCDKKHLKDINDIIVKINVVKFRKEDLKKEELKKYMNRQEYLRDTYLTDDLLISSFCYDALVLQAILYQKLDSIEEKDFVLASLNYLINVCPMFFKDSDIRKIVFEELENIKSIKGYPHSIKKYVKDTRNLLNEIIKEG